MTYSDEIQKATNHAELKAIGAKLFNSKMSQEKKNPLISIYRERRRELDRVMVDNSTNTTLKRLLYAINTMANDGVVEVAKTGKQIYELTKTGMLDKFESDLAFRAYRHQKRKAGIEFQTEAPF